MLLYVLQHLCFSICTAMHELQCMSYRTCTKVCMGDSATVCAAPHRAKPIGVQCTVALIEMRCTNALPSHGVCLQTVSLPVLRDSALPLLFSHIQKMPLRRQSIVAFACLLESHVLGITQMPLAAPLVAFLTECVYQA